MENIFDQFTVALNKIQGSGLPASKAAATIIEISEQVPAPTRAPVGNDLEEFLQAVSEKSDEELDIMKAQIFGFAKINETASIFRGRNDQTKDLSNMFC